MRSLAYLSLLASLSLVGAHNANSRSRAHMHKARQLSISASASASISASIVGSTSFTDSFSATATATSTASAGGATSTGNVTEVEMVAAAWYAGYHASDFPVSNISWDKYTQVTYAFACVFRLFPRCLSPC